MTCSNGPARAPVDGPTAGWQGHVIVCGLHDVGMRVIELLRIAGEPVVVLDDRPDPRRVRVCREVGAAVIEASGEPGVAARAAAAIKSRWHLDVFGVRSPTRSAMDDPRAAAEVADWVRASGTMLLLLAMGGGRQEHWIDRHRDRLGPCVAMGVGSALDFIAGTRRRAPEFLQRRGLEWAWRLSYEPGRLWHRYLVDDPRVLAQFALDRLVRA